MKFIIPQNYNFKSKIFGIIDYSTAFLNIFRYQILFSSVSLFPAVWAHGTTRCGTARRNIIFPT